MTSLSVRKSIVGRLVEELDGLELLLETMAKFHDNAKIQAHCCVIFYEMANDNNLRVPMEKAGVVAAVSGVLHIDNEDVKKYAKEFMTQMYSNN